MPKCSVTNCPNNNRYVRKKDGVSYYSFPRNPIRCSEWTVIIAKTRNDINYKPYKGSIVCLNQFPSSDIYTTTKDFSRLNKKAKPILNLIKRQLRSNDNSDQDNTHDDFNQDNNQEPIEQNEESIEWSFNIDNELGNSEEIRQQTNILCLQEDNTRKIEQSLSTSFSIGSILDTPRKTVMKNKVNLCEKIIQNKNRQINRLQKQNKRLIKKNTTLKKTL